MARAGAREGAWPADQAERWPIDRLIPYAKNSRTHENEKRAAAASVAARVNELSQQPARATSEPSRADQVGTSAAGGDRPDHRRISLGNRDDRQPLLRF
jgi:hypothetical protein